MRDDELRAPNGRFLPKRIKEELLGRVAGKKKETPPDDTAIKLLDACSKDIALFASVFLEHHVEKPFCRFHHDLFKTLKRLAADQLSKNAEKRKETTPTDQSYIEPLVTKNIKEGTNEIGQKSDSPTPLDMACGPRTSSSGEDGVCKGGNSDGELPLCVTEKHDIDHGIDAERGSVGGGDDDDVCVVASQPNTQFSDQNSVLTQVPDIIGVTKESNSSSTLSKSNEAKPRISEQKANDIKGGTKVTKKYNSVVVAAPRGHAKSTVVSLVFVLWCICYKVEEYILLISDSEDQSKMNLDSVKAELEDNEKLRLVFGDLVGRIWGAEAIETQNGVRIQVRGSGQRIRGLKYRRSRPGLMILDDIENDTLVDTSDQRHKLKRWFYAAVRPALRRGGKTVVIGTILHEDSLLSDLLDARGWYSMKYQCETSGVPLWPECYSMEQIDEIKQEYGEKGQLPLFYREYYNQIVDFENASFKREFFKYTTVADLVARKKTENFKTFLLIDPAYTTHTRSDYTAIVILLTDDKNNLYVIDGKKGRFTMTQTIDLLFEYYQAYRPDMGMQTVDWKKSFQKPMEDEMRRRGLHFRVNELPTYSQTLGMFNKKSRIERLSPRYANGSVVHLEGVPIIKDLEDELVMFPRAKNEDLSDALAMSIDLIWPAQPKRRRKSKYINISVVDKVSGY